MTQLRILVVDDDHDHADSLAELFTMEGHQVTVAYGGDEAIAAYDRCDYDLAFIDVIMPGRNGVESFLAIRALKPDTKVYMMTGYSVEQLLRQAVENGAMGVLSKPLDPTRIFAAIDNVSPSGIVLVAEDDPDFGPSLQNLIAQTGRCCELVTNGRDALQRMDHGGIDVLILDLNMPLIDGINVYSTLRKRGQAVPTIIITAFVDQYEAAVSGLIDIETTGILIKPFDPAVLIDRLERLTASARPAQVPAGFHSQEAVSRRTRVAQ